MTRATLDHVSVAIPALDHWTLRVPARTVPLAPGTVQVHATGLPAWVRLDRAGVQRRDMPADAAPAQVPLEDADVLEATCVVRERGAQRTLVLQDGWLHLRVVEVARLLAGLPHPGALRLCTDDDSLPAIVGAEGLVLPVPASMLLPGVEPGAGPGPDVLPLVLRRDSQGWWWRLADRAPASRLPVFADRPWLRLGEGLAEVAALLRRTVPRLRFLDLGTTAGLWSQGPPSLSAPGPCQLCFTTGEARALVEGGDRALGAAADPDALLDDLPLRPEWLAVGTGEHEAHATLGEGPLPVGTPAGGSPEAGPAAAEPGLALRWTDEDGPVEAAYDLPLSAVPPGDRPASPFLTVLWIRMTDGWLQLGDGKPVSETGFGWGRSAVASETRAVRLLPWLLDRAALPEGSGGQLELLLDNTGGTTLRADYARAADGALSLAGVELACREPGVRCAAGRHGSAGLGQVTPSCPPIDDPAGTGPRADSLLLLSPSLVHRAHALPSPLVVRLVAAGPAEEERAAPDGDSALHWQVETPPGLCARWWRRTTPVPLVGHPLCAVNDPAATPGAGAVSGLQGLVPHDLELSAGLRLSQRSPGEPFSVAWQQDRRLRLHAATARDPLLAPLPEHLGIEVHGVDDELADREQPWQVLARVRARYAVPLLDRHLDPGGLPATTYVQDRYADADWYHLNAGPEADGGRQPFQPRLLTLNPQDAPLGPGTRAAPELAEVVGFVAAMSTWREIAPPAGPVGGTSFTEERRVSPLGARAHLEWADDTRSALRRWSIGPASRALFAHWLEIEPRTLQIDGEGALLEVLLGAGSHRSRLGLHLAGSGELHLLPGAPDLADGTPGRLVLTGPELRAALLGQPAPASAGRPDWWVTASELEVVTEGGAALVARGLTVWLQDGELVRLRTAHCLRIGAGGVDPATGQPRPVMTLDPEGAPQDPVLVLDGSDLRVVRRIRTNGLLVEERYRGAAERIAVYVTTGEPTAADALADLASYASGRRVVVAWAGSHVVPDPERYQPYGPGFTVTRLQRLYLELQRRSDGGARVVGAFVGWTAGELFGLPVHDELHPADAHGRRDGPHLTFVLPVLSGEPAPGRARGTIELNGVWRDLMRAPGTGAPEDTWEHELSLVCWDSRLDLVRPGPDRLAPGQEADDNLEPAGRLPVLARHELRHPGGDHRPVSWFAWQTARVGGGSLGRHLDMSAVHALRPWAGGPEQLASAASHRPGTLLVRTQPAAPPAGRLQDDDSVTIVGLPLRLMGVARERAAAHLEPVEGWASLELDPPLAPLRPDAAGAAAEGPWYAPAAARSWQSLPSPSAFRIGELPEGRSPLAPATASCTAWTLYEQPATGPGEGDPGPRTRWLACEVIALERGNSPPPPAASTASLPARIRVFGEDGMQTLHRFADVPGVPDAAVVSQAEAVLAWAGWHRQAILEQPGPRWSLVDSPLPDWTAEATDTAAPEAAAGVGGADPARILEAPGALPLRIVASGRVASGRVASGVASEPQPPSIASLDLCFPPARTEGAAAYAPEALDQWHPSYVRATLETDDGADALAVLPDAGDRLVLSVDRRVPFLVDRPGSEDLGLPRWTPGLPDQTSAGRAYLAKTTRLDLVSPRPGEKVTWGLATTALRTIGTTRTRLASAEKVFTVRTPRSPDDQEEVHARATALAEAADGIAPWRVAWKRYHPERYRTDDPARDVILAVQAPGDPRVLPGERVRVWWWILGDEAGRRTTTHGHLYLRFRADVPGYAPELSSGGVKGLRAVASAEGWDVPLLPTDEDGRIFPRTTGSAETPVLPAHGVIELRFAVADPAVPPQAEARWSISLATTRSDDKTKRVPSSSWSARIVTLDPAITVVPPDSRLVKPPPSFVTVSRRPGGRGASTLAEQVLAHGAAPSSGWIPVEVPEQQAVRWMLEGEVSTWDLAATTAEDWRVSVVGPDGSTAQAWVPPAGGEPVG